jgi:hypothetical protein
LSTAEDLDWNALYELLGVRQAETITFFFRRNRGGPVGFLKGLFTPPQVIEVDEKSCFEFAQIFASRSPNSNDQSQSAYNLIHAGCAIQRVKLERGLPLDCAQHARAATVVVDRYNG